MTKDIDRSNDDRLFIFAGCWAIKWVFNLDLSCKSVVRAVLFPVYFRLPQPLVITARVNLAQIISDIDDLLCELIPLRRHRRHVSLSRLDIAESVIAERRRW